MKEDLREAVHAWIREDCGVGLKMLLTREVTDALLDRLALITSAKPGWVLVPQRITTDVRDAIADEFWPWVIGSMKSDDMTTTAQAAYRAMIAAAPTPEGREVEGA